METANELDTLFSAVWMDEAPIQVLADYIREKLSDMTPYGTLKATHVLSGGVSVERQFDVHLTVERFYGEKCVVQAVIYCPKHFWNVAKNFTVETISTPEFTDWLTEQMNDLSFEAMKPSWGRME